MMPHHGRVGLVDLYCYIQVITSSSFDVVGLDVVVFSFGHVDPLASSCLTINLVIVPEARGPIDFKNLLGVIDYFWAFTRLRAKKQATIVVTCHEEPILSGLWGLEPAFHNVAKVASLIFRRTKLGGDLLVSREAEIGIIRDGIDVDLLFSFGCVDKGPTHAMMTYVIAWYH